MSMTRRGPHKTAKVEIDRQALVELYLSRKLSTIEVGRLLGCSKKTVRLRLIEYGIPIRTPHEAMSVSTSRVDLSRRGPESPAWRGGISLKSGYVRVWNPEHYDADCDGYVMLHRLVAAAIIGRPIASDEHVHHLNGDKTDNSPENITVMTRSEHLSLHMSERHKAGKIPYGRSWINRQTEMARETGR